MNNFTAANTIEKREYGETSYKDEFILQINKYRRMNRKSDFYYFFFNFSGNGSSQLLL